MNIITRKKIVAILITTVVIITMGTQVFAANKFSTNIVNLLKITSNFSGIISKIRKEIKDIDLEKVGEKVDAAIKDTTNNLKDVADKIEEEIKEIDVGDAKKNITTVIKKTTNLFGKILAKIKGTLTPTPTPEPEKDLKLNKTSVTINKGETAQLTATYGGSTVKPTYSSSNTNIATIDSNGKITAKAKGSATITAKYDGKTVTCSVVVNEVQSNNFTRNRQFRFTYYTKESCGTSSTGSGKNESHFGIDPTLGCYTYQGKVVLAAATNRLQKNGNYDRREHVYYFDYYDEVEFTFKGKKYTGIILDSCGVSMRPEYYYSGANAKVNVLDMFFPTNAAATRSGINQHILTVYY